MRVRRARKARRAKRVKKSNRTRKLRLGPKGFLRKFVTWGRAKIIFQCQFLFYSRNLTRSRFDVVSLASEGFFLPLNSSVRRCKCLSGQSHLSFAGIIFQIFLSATFLYEKKKVTASAPYFPKTPGMIYSLWSCSPN